jgi:restriction endonuclease S subunit
MHAEYSELCPTLSTQDRGAEIRDAFTDDDESHQATLKKLEAAHLREQVRSSYTTVLLLH